MKTNVDNDFFRTMIDERKELLDVLRKTRFSQLAEGFVHEQVIPFASYAPWASNSEFSKLYGQVRTSTLIDKYRLWELWTLLKGMSALQGDVLEVGVWKGGSGALLAKAAEGGETSPRVFLCDTFRGVVKAGPRDTLYQGGEHSDTSQAEVERLLERLEIKNASLLTGVFPDDFKERLQDTRFKFCHIDVDTFESAKGVFDFIWPRIVVGGAIVFDDYGFWGCEGVTRLFDEMLLVNGVKIHNLNGHGILIKTRD